MKSYKSLLEQKELFCDADARWRSLPDESKVSILELVAALILQRTLSEFRQNENHDKEAIHAR
jgi:hypothetical protein